jgi:adenine-specific DNA-methyltransferase
MQVQIIYMDPPFVHKRDVTNGDCEDMTRELEIVKAFHDTWEHGSHSYRSFLPDRLLLYREVLYPSGSYHPALR